MAKAKKDVADTIAESMGAKPVVKNLTKQQWTDQMIALLKKDTKVEKKETTKDDAYYAHLIDGGKLALTTYFNNASDIDKNSSPWVTGLKSKTIPPYADGYAKFKAEVQDDEIRPLLWQGVKMASQDLWFKENGLDDATNMTNQLKHALISYKNDDTKKALVAKFLASDMVKNPANLTRIAKSVYAEAEPKVQDKPHVILQTSDILQAGELNSLYNDAEKLSKELVDASKQYDKATRQVNDTLREVQMVYSELISIIKTAIKLAGSTPKLKPKRKRRKKAE